MGSPLQLILARLISAVISPPTDHSSSRSAPNKLETVTRQLRSPTNFATFLESKIKEEVRIQEDKAKEQGDVEAETKLAEEKKQEKKKGVDEDAIRNAAREELHAEMDKRVDNRHSRFLHAELTKDTTTQWDLIAAAVKEANIRYHQLVGKESDRVRGRSKVSFKKTKEGRYSKA